MSAAALRGGVTTMTTTMGLRRSGALVLRRFASEQPSNPLLETTKKPPSRIRAVFFGFLAGVTASCGFAYGMLTEDIEKSAGNLQASVSALGREVSKISDALAKVDDLEQQVQVLRAKAAAQSQLDDLTQRVQQQQDSVAMTLSQHKAAVWEAQEEMFKSIARLESQQQQQQQQQSSLSGESTTSRIARSIGSAWSAFKQRSSAPAPSATATGTAGGMDTSSTPTAAAMTASSEGAFFRAAQQAVSSWTSEAAKTFTSATANASNGGGDGAGDGGDSDDTDVDAEDEGQLVVPGLDAFTQMMTTASRVQAEAAEEQRRLMDEPQPYIIDLDRTDFVVGARKADYFRVQQLWEMSTSHTDYWRSKAVVNFIFRVLAGTVEKPESPLSPPPSPTTMDEQPDEQQQQQEREATEEEKRRARQQHGADATSGDGDMMSEEEEAESFEHDDAGQADQQQSTAHDLD